LRRPVRFSAKTCPNVPTVMPRPGLNFECDAKPTAIRRGRNRDDTVRRRGRRPDADPVCDTTTIVLRAHCRGRF
jgi:hypothetical protein